MTDNEAVNTIDVSAWLNDVDEETHSLDLSNVSLTDQVGAKIVRSLPPSLVTLKVEGNSFSLLTASALAALLKRNSSLQHIFLDSNPLNVGSNDFESFSVFAKSLEENTTLRSLSLRRCGIGKKGCSALCNAVQNNNTLISLELSYNNCDESDARSMKEKLSRNRKVYQDQLASKAQANEEKRRESLQKLQEQERMQKEKDTVEWLAAEKAKREEQRRNESERQLLKQQEDLAYKLRMEEIYKMEEERKAAKKKKKGKKGKGKKKK